MAGLSRLCGRRSGQGSFGCGEEWGLYFVYGKVLLELEWEVCCVGFHDTEEYNQLMRYEIKDFMILELRQCRIICAIGRINSLILLRSMDKNTLASHRLEVWLELCFDLSLHGLRPHLKCSRQGTYGYIINVYETLLGITSAWGR